MHHPELNKLNPDTVTIGEIVAADYNAAAVFRQYGLDFCCGGGITLAKACKERNIHTDEVLSELKSIGPAFSTGNENYRAWEADYLIDYIINTHHNFVRRKTDEISVYAKKVAEVHGEHHPENVEIFRTFVALSYELMTHLRAEEEEVFPLIRKIHNKRKRGEAVSDQEIEALEKQLHEMVDDHEGAGQLIADIRQLSHDFTPPGDACATYRILYQNLEGFEQDLHKHVHLENNILFKKAEELIS